MMDTFRSRVLKTIEDHWPVHITEIAKELDMNPTKNSSITKIRYHINKLEREGKVHRKKIGQAVVVWPQEIEKLRFVHELLK